MFADVKRFPPSEIKFWIVTTGAQFSDPTIVVQKLPIPSFIQTSPVTIITIITIITKEDLEHLAHPILDSTL